jgi:hypothetical protein
MKFSARDGSGSYGYHPQSLYRKVMRKMQRSAQVLQQSFCKDYGPRIKMRTFMSHFPAQMGNKPAGL